MSEKLIMSVRRTSARIQGVGPVPFHARLIYTVGQERIIFDAVFGENRVATIRCADMPANLNPADLNRLVDMTVDLERQGFKFRPVSIQAVNVGENPKYNDGVNFNLAIGQLTKWEGLNKTHLESNLSSAGLAGFLPILARSPTVRNP